MAKPELDKYDNEGIDDESQDEMDYETRRELNKKMDLEERMRQKGKGRMPVALLGDDLNEYSGDDDINRQIRQERMRLLRQGEGEIIGDEDQYMNDDLDLEDVKGKLSLWVQK